MTIARRALILTTATMMIASSLGEAVDASSDCSLDAMVVFDGSGSISEVGFNQLGVPRIFEAREAVRDAMPEIAIYRRLGLIIYGPGDGSACSNIDLRFEPMVDAAPSIIGAVDTLEPSGNTALTEAVLRAAQTLDYVNNPGAVVLITDGKETCGGSPCALAAEFAGSAYDLTVHVIGFKIRVDFFSWDSQGRDDYLNADTVAGSLADMTGGKYVTTETVDELAGALRETLGCALTG